MPASPIQSSPDRFAELPNGLRICWRSYGRRQDPALLLVAGLGLQLISWPQALIDGLVAAGLQVIAVDNRDMGQSSSLPMQPPARLRQFFGWIPAGHYRLEDMADDLLALLDHLGIARAHVLGMSMGGMIAQAMAVRQPQRVWSLTSIFSTTGDRRVGQPAPSTLWRMLRARPPMNLAEAQDMYVATMRHIGDPSVPGIEAVWRDYIARAWERSNPLDAQQRYERQTTAILLSGDRTASLRAIQAPTLVLHGDKDLIVHPSGGQATARAISGARLITVAGMRHQIDTQRCPQLLGLILPHLEHAYHRPHPSHSTQRERV